MFLLFLHAKKLLICHGQAAGQAEYIPGIIPVCSSDDRTQSLYGYDSQCLRSLQPVHSSLSAYEEPPFLLSWKEYTMKKGHCQFFRTDVALRHNALRCVLTEKTHGIQQLIERGFPAE